MFVCVCVCVLCIKVHFVCVRRTQPQNYYYMDGKRILFLYTIIISDLHSFRQE